MRQISRRRIAPLVWMCAFAVAPSACGSETGTGSTTDDFLPVFTNFWRNVAVSTHTLVLTSTDDRKATGAFSGEERHPTFNVSLMGGTFTNSTSEVTVRRNGGNVVYAGKFVSRDTLRLTRTGETVVFARQ